MALLSAREPAVIFRRYPITAERVRRALAESGQPTDGPPRGGTPAVVVLPQPGDAPLPVIGGRYFPELHACAVYEHPRRELTDATICHEIVHAAGHMRHDAAFYEALERLHRAMRTPPRAAREVERAGRYAFPASWREREEW